MVIGAIVGAVVFVGFIISGYEFDNIEDIPKYVTYNGAIGAILGPPFYSSTYNWMATPN